MLERDVAPITGEKVMALQLCKLTTQDLTTHNGFQWKLNEPVPVLSGKGGLCSNTVYHCYEHPLLAILLNPIHADIKNPKLFSIEIPAPYDLEPLLDAGLKRGYRTMTLIEELPLPEIPIINTVAFGILCALEVEQSAKFQRWAEMWLNGKDRSAARAAAEAAEAAAARAAAAEAAEAAATRAARAAAAATVATVAAEATAARAAAEATAEAAEAVTLNLIEIAEKAMRIE
jgi:hypothetical protein